jgi:hypothetical protein
MSPSFTAARAGDEASLLWFREHSTENSRLVVNALLRMREYSNSNIGCSYRDILNSLQPIAMTESFRIDATVLDIIHRPVFYLKHTMDNVRTSLETY